MATKTYTILAPGGSLTKRADGAGYRKAVIVRANDNAKWEVACLHRDLKAAISDCMRQRATGWLAKVVAAVMVQDGETLILGAVDERQIEEVDRLREGADRAFQQSVAEGRGTDHYYTLCGDFKAYQRWIDKIRAQIKTV